MNCLNCNAIHDGSYGSGKFCSVKCAKGYSTKVKREEINKKLSDALRNKPSPHRGKTYKLSDEALKSRKEKLKNKEYNSTKFLAAPFEELGSTLRKKRILHEQNGVCSCCAIKPEWNGKPLTFQLDHIDGNRKNNSRENLRLLCPNCHSQTDTFGSKNVSKEGKEKILKTLLINGFQKCGVAPGFEP